MAASPATSLQQVIRVVTRLGGKVRDGVAFTAAEVDLIERLLGATVGRRERDFGAMSDADLAAAFGVSRRTVLNWHSAGLPRNADGTHALPAVARWYAERGGDLAGRPLSGASAEADVALKQARKKLLELRLNQENGKLIGLDLAKRVWERHVVEARTVLSGIVERVVLAVPPEARGVVRGQVDGIIRKACADLADAQGQLRTRQDGVRAPRGRRLGS